MIGKDNKENKENSTEEELQNKVNEKNRIKSIKIIPEEEFLRIVYGDKGKVVILKERCKLLREKAFEKLEEDRKKGEKTLFSDAEKIGILYLVDEMRTMQRPQSEHLSGIIQQITRDFNTGYKKFDCLAMWLDSELGLAAYDPELIIKIAEKFGEIHE